VIRINEKFARMLEIDRDSVADSRLDLSDAPFRFVWVADVRSGQIFTEQVTLLGWHETDCMALVSI
jgi:hypothetical protein